MLKEYIRYYHEDRTHLGLEKDTPDGRVATSPPSSQKVISLYLRLPLSFPYSLVVTAVIGLGLMVPSDPAAIGTYEFFVVAAVGLAGITSGSALAYAVLLHSWAFLTPSIVGLACLVWAGLTLKQLVREEEAWEKHGAPDADGNK